MSLSRLAATSSGCDDPIELRADDKLPFIASWKASSARVENSVLPVSSASRLTQALTNTTSVWVAKEDHNTVIVCMFVQIHQALALMACLLRIM